VARVIKPHGLMGEVVVELLSNRPERLSPGVSLESEKGPIVIQRSRPFQGRYLATFEGVVTREGAETLRGVVLLAPPLDEPDTLWVHELIGAKVVDQRKNDLGQVVAVEENPASDLLVLDSGVLIPLRFVTNVVAGESIDVTIPEGLTELD